MSTIWKFAVIVLMLVSCSALEAQEEDYNLAIYDEESNEQTFDQAPEFITKNSTLFVDIGGSIRLPCVIKHEDYFTRIWRRNNIGITLGNAVLKKV